MPMDEGKQYSESYPTGCLAENTLFEMPANSAGGFNKYGCTWEQVSECRVHYCNIMIVIVQRDSQHGVERLQAGIQRRRNKRQAENVGFGVQGEKP